MSDKPIVDKAIDTVSTNADAATSFVIPGYDEGKNLLKTIREKGEMTIGETGRFMLTGDLNSAIKALDGTTAILTPTKDFAATVPLACTPVLWAFVSEEAAKMPSQFANKLAGGDNHNAPDSVSDAADRVINQSLVIYAYNAVAEKFWGGKRLTDDLDLTKRIDVRDLEKWIEKTRQTKFPQSESLEGLTVTQHNAVVDEAMAHITKGTQIVDYSKQRALTTDEFLAARKINQTVSFKEVTEWIDARRKPDEGWEQYVQQYQKEHAGSIVVLENDLKADGYAFREHYKPKTNAPHDATQPPTHSPAAPKRHTKTESNANVVGFASLAFAASALLVPGAGIPIALLGGGLAGFAFFGDRIIGRDVFAKTTAAVESVSQPAAATPPDASAPAGNNQQLGTLQSPPTLHSMASEPEMYKGRD